MYRGSAKKHKIRTITTTSNGYEAYGITIPKEVASLYMNVYYSIKVSGTTIILESGCK